MKRLIALIGKDFRIFMKDKAAVALTFIVPLVMIVIFGFVFGGIGKGTSPIHIIAINQSPAPIAAKLIQALDSSKSLRVIKTYTTEDRPGVKLPFTDSLAAVWVRGGKVPAALIIPPDALSDTSAGLHLILLHDPRNEIESNLLEGVLQQTIMTKTPSLFPSLLQRSALKYLGPDSGSAFNGAIRNLVGKYFPIPEGNVADWLARQDTSSTLAGTGESGAGKFFSDLIHFERRQLVGEKIVNPMVTRSIGGWAIMFVLFTLTAAARSIIYERDHGTLHRLLSTPTTRGTILLSKFAYSWILGFVQIIVLFVASSLIFSVDIYSNIINLLIISLLTAGASTSFGMVLASFARTEQQADALSMVLILSMSAVGGSWFPVSLMPEFIQSISRFTLTYWAVEGFLNVLWRNQTFLQLLPTMAILAGITVVLTSLSLWLFQKRASL
jgi:ABC-2 type transport system permease protein